MWQVSTFSRSSLSVLATGWLCGTLNVAAANDLESMRECAKRDVRIVTLIEDHGSTIPPLVDDETLSKAGMLLIDARSSCSGGREAEGIAIYDRITAMLGAVPPRQTQ